MRTLLLAFLLFPTLAHAERLTVVELYTSQGCSSCPPAEAVLSQLKRTDPGVLPLGMHVTYWDRLGWKDPYALPAATQRQRDASARLSLGYVYTPQMVIDGRLQAIGSDGAAIRRAISQAQAARGAEVPLTLAPAPAGMQVRVGAGTARGTVLLVGFDAQHTTPVRAGENGGRTLTEVNVVRSLTTIGTWTGTPLELLAAAPAGERAAVLLQADDGRILAATAL